MGAVDGGGVTRGGIDRTAALLRRQGTGGAQMRIGRVGGNKGLGLRGDGGEDAFLLEALAVGTPSVLGGLEARTPDLGCVSLASGVLGAGEGPRLRTLRRRQYRQAMAVRCRGAGWFWYMGCGGGGGR